MFKHYLKLTLKLLNRKRVFTLVTLAGIILPVLLIVLTASFLTRVNDYTPPRSNFKNVVSLDNVTLKEILEDGDVNMRMGNPPTYGFIQKYVRSMTTPEKIGVVSTPSHDQDIIYLNSKPYEIDIRYTDDVFWQIADFEFIRGRPFSSSEIQKGNKVIVIDRKTSMACFGTINTIGENVMVKNQNYKVIGVIENVDILYFRLSGNIYMPVTCNEEFLSNSIWSGFSIALIQLKNTKDFEKLNNEFKNILQKVDIKDIQPCNHAGGSFTKDNYLGRIKLMFQSLLGFYEFENLIFYLAIAIILFLFIILPSMNLVNININRVYERLSEIGIRRSFGSSIKKLMIQFLFENLIITLFGGLLAVVLALIVIYCINHFGLLAGVYLHFNIRAFVISILSMFMLGLLSGLAPSIKMARKKIILSLNTTS